MARGSANELVGALPVDEPGAGSRQRALHSVSSHEFPHQVSYMDRIISHQVSYTDRTISKVTVSAMTNVARGSADKLVGALPVDEPALGFRV